MQRRVSLFVAVMVAVVATAVPAQSGSASGSAAPNTLADVHVKLVPVVSGLQQPIAIAWKASDPSVMYVAEQRGHVRVVQGGKVVSTALTLDVSHGDEQGLLGLAITHDGARMYVDYTDPNGDTRVVEYTMPGTRATAPRQILFQHQPFDNHNGGQVTIGPDGMLYVAFGDGGSGGDPQGNGQNRGTWLGKILRIDPRPLNGMPYRIPPNNPFVGRVGMRPEIWMWGLRNPWRWSFDHSTNDVWIGDVGQENYEEVDFELAGRAGINWGWNRREGDHAYLGGTQPAGGHDPLIERSHALGDCAVVGGYVYRGAVIPALRGAYVYGDYCTGELRAVVQSGGHITQSRDLGLNVSQLVSFAQGPKGELRALSADGTIYLIAPA